jgi:DNA-binding NarL/FixJ family response regulator
MIDVAIVEDDRDIRNGIKAYLNTQKQVRCLQAFDSAEKLLKDLEDGNIPQVLLMDIELPGMSGIDGIKIVKEKYPDIDIMMLTIYHDSEKIFKSLCAGATGYLLKNTPLAEINDHIVTLKEGGAPMSPQIARKVTEFFLRDKLRNVTEFLTEREKEVVNGLVDGLSYKMIAARMSVTIETVRFHIKNIYKKLQVNSKGEIISRYLKNSI